MCQALGKLQRFSRPQIFAGIGKDLVVRFETGAKVRRIRRNLHGRRWLHECLPMASHNEGLSPHRVLLPLGEGTLELRSERAAPSPLPGGEGQGEGRVPQFDTPSAAKLCPCGWPEGRSLPPSPGLPPPRGELRNSRSAAAVRAPGAPWIGRGHVSRSARSWRRRYRRPAAC